jgi:hypothetical protein
MQIKELLEDKTFLERELTECRACLEQELELLRKDTDSVQKGMSQDLMQLKEELELLSNFKMVKATLEQQGIQLQVDKEETMKQCKHEIHQLVAPQSRYACFFFVDCSV